MDDNCPTCGHTWASHDLATLDIVVCGVEDCKCNSMTPNQILFNDYLEIEATRSGLSIKSLSRGDDNAEHEFVIPLKRIRSYRVLREKLERIHELITPAHSRLVNYDKFSPKGLYEFCTPDIGQAINQLIDLIQVLKQE